MAANSQSPHRPEKRPLCWFPPRRDAPSRRRYAWPAGESGPGPRCRAPPRPASPLSCPCRPRHGPRPGAADPAPTRHRARWCSGSSSVRRSVAARRQRGAGAPGRPSDGRPPGERRRGQGRASTACPGPPPARTGPGPSGGPPRPASGAARTAGAWPDPTAHQRCPPASARSAPPQAQRPGAVPPNGPRHCSASPWLRPANGPPWPGRKAAPASGRCPRHWPPRPSARRDKNRQAGSPPRRSDSPGDRTCPRSPRRKCGPPAQ